MGPYLRPLAAGERECIADAAIAAIKITRTDHAVAVDDARAHLDDGGVAGEDDRARDPQAAGPAIDPAAPTPARKAHPKPPQFQVRLASNAANESPGPHFLETAPDFLRSIPPGPPTRANR